MVSIALHSPGGAPLNTPGHGDYMKSFARIAAVASIAFASAAGTLSAQALPTASEVIAKHIAAVGGRDAIMKITSMQQKGTMEIPTMGLTAQSEMSMAQNRVAVKQTIPGIGEITQGFDGTTAWSSNPMQGPRILSGKELEQQKEQADLQASMLYTPERFTTMETVSLADFNGEKAYKVRFVRKGSGRESFEYFSQATGFQIGSEMTQESEMGKMSLTTSQGAYKQFGALKMPTRSEVVAGPNKMVMTISEVTFNAVPASVFELPPQVKALVKP